MCHPAFLETGHSCLVPRLEISIQKAARIPLCQRSLGVIDLAQGQGPESALVAPDEMPGLPLCLESQSTNSGGRVLTIVGILIVIILILLVVYLFRRA